MNYQVLTQTHKMKNAQVTNKMPWDNDTGTDTAETNSTAVEEKQGFKLQLPDKLTKDNFNEVSKIIFNEIDGNTDPLKAFIKLKAYLEVLGLLKNKLTDSAINEANKFAKGEKTILGVKFEVTSGATRYDYSEDQTWADLKKQLNERQELLKGLKTEMADTSSGEIIKPAIPIHSGEVIKITFEK